MQYIHKTLTSSQFLAVTDQRLFLPILHETVENVGFMRCVYLLGFAIVFLHETVLLSSVHCSNSCVQNLPNASDIQALTMDSRNQLVAPVQQLRVFPNITFTCNGSIVGWRLAAIDHTRRGRPELSVWRRNRNSANQFAKVTGRRIDSCTVSESMRTLGASTVMIHENILNPPIPFEAGDVLGILFLIDTSASYIPLLYNVTGSGGLMSYYRTARGSPQNDVFTLTNVAQDTLSPLISLQMCKSNMLYIYHKSCMKLIWNDYDSFFFAKVFLKCCFDGLFKVIAG